MNRVYEAPGWYSDVPQDRPLRIVFMGTPAFAVPTLEALIAGPHDVVSVYTQPDRRQGRGRKLKAPPVKEVALAAGIPVRQPEKLATKEWFVQFNEDQPDLAVVVAYGKILRPRFLCVPPLGCINCHASLLPYYRGAAPIYWSIANGESETGMTTMWMNAGMDTGPELLRQSIPIGADENVGSVHDRLSNLGADLLVQTVDQLVAGTLQVTPQEHELATHAPMLSKHDNWVDFDRPSSTVHNHVRAMDPFPGGRVLLDNQQTLKLFGSHEEPEIQGEAGTLLDWTSDAMIVGCKTGAVAFKEIQLSGKKRMTVKQFLAGRVFPKGTRLTLPELPSTTQKS